MGERKGVNKYYPPDYDPSKGSINKHVGQHPLRERARKISQGILVIRFEMPYNIWCGGCGIHIAMGVRYNAEKKKVGNYYTTPIYEFRMRCHLCPQYFVIVTDPKNHDYVIQEGARRKEQRWDPHANEQIVPEDKATHKKLATDSMYLLEHGSNDKAISKSRSKSLATLSDSREQFTDDYSLNTLARDKFRGEKRELTKRKAVDDALLKKSSLDIQLLPETEEDKKLASLLQYDCPDISVDFQEKKSKILNKLAKSPFGGKSSSSTQSISIERQKLGLNFGRSSHNKTNTVDKTTDVGDNQSSTSVNSRDQFDDSVYKIVPDKSSINCPDDNASKSLCNNLVKLQNVYDSSTDSQSD